MTKEELLERQKTIEAKFNELQVQKNEIEKELLRLNGQYILLEDLLAQPDSTEK